ENQTRLVWQNFPALSIFNQPNPIRINATRSFNETVSPGTNSLNTSGVPPREQCINVPGDVDDCRPGITQNRSIPLSRPGQQVLLFWERPGKAVGPNNSYVSRTQA